MVVFSRDYGGTKTVPPQPKKKKEKMKMKNENKNKNLKNKKDYLDNLLKMKRKMMR
jgi:hypothetical protein